MSVNPDVFNNLHPRKVLDGEFYIEGSDVNDFNPIKMQMYVGPSGGMFARPVPPIPIDQVGEKEATPINRRHQGCDQV